MRDERGQPCVHEEHFKLVSESMNTASNQMLDYDSKLAKNCHKSGIISALSAKIMSLYSDNSHLDSNQLNHAHTQRKVFSTLKGEIDIKYASAEQSLLGFDKLKEEHHEFEYVALTSSC